MSNNNNNFFDKLVSKTKVYLVIIAILLIIICIIKPILIVPAFIVYILIIMYAYWANQKRMAEVSEHIKDLTLNVDKVSKRTLINSPFPLIIVETDGSIIWKSTKFVSEFRDVEINPILDEIIKDLKLEIENNTKLRNNQISQNVEIGNKSYKIVGEYVKSKQVDRKKEYMATLYFVDETEIVNLKKDYEDSQVCVGIAMIDNYEEIIQRTSGDVQVQLFSQIEKTIYDWIAEIKGVVVKAERDTFVWICEQKYLKQLEESKFNILDIIKEINISSKVQSTLSIAVSNEGDTYSEKYKSTKTAIDIALGRGGDQAIVRKNGKYSFYGGRTQELEKRTRVKARSVANALEELMLEAENVVIMGHTNSDIDALGSALGIYRLAKTLGKDAHIASGTIGIGLENFVEYAKRDEEYQKAIIDKQEAIDITNSRTLLVVVDTHKKSYSDVPELVDMAGKIAIIDHHRMSTDYIENAVLTFQEVYASSAAELVTELITYSEQNVKLTNVEAEGLYAGIMMDTKNFTFKTGVRTFEAAAYLRKCGVDIIKVKKWFQSDLETYNTISEIVAKSEIVGESIAISVYDKVDKDANIICAKAADELLTISDITASFVIGNYGEKICISGRSLGDINVQVILEKLGGGGHITLAGAQVEGMDIYEVKRELIEKIKEYFSEQI
ncbi:MAG: DHH family phosphoesterase [Clostridia bacterium]|nr:DHH family phosphoesterase [Clostridia bacterium]